MSNPVESAGQPQALDPSAFAAASHEIMSTDLGPTSWFEFDLIDADLKSAISTAAPSEMTKRPGQILFAPLSTPSQVPKTWANLAAANSSKWGAYTPPASTSAPNQRKALNIHELFLGGGGSTEVVEGSAATGVPHADPSKLTSDALLPSTIPERSSLSTSTTATERPKRPVPGPLDLSSAKSNQKASRPSALARARIIEDLNAVPYPEAIKTPHPGLNITAAPGKFRYDREFLLQFMNVCKEKPDSLPPLDAIGLEPSEQGAASYPGGARQGGRRVGPMGMSGAPGIQRQGSIGLGLGNVQVPKGGFSMRSFQAPPSRLGDSQSRFEVSTAAGVPFSPGTTSRLTPMMRSQGGVSRAGEPSDIESLLNRFTTEEFDLISGQIIEWVNEIKEKDGSTLRRVARLVFEKAKDETAFSEMYARLCREIVDHVSPNIQDETNRDYEGHLITGGSLFRKYLTGLCQEDFERGWSGEGKRQGLGVVRFIGELFKQRLLTERVMHVCIKRLLSNVADPKEEEIESLCELLRTVGPNIDTAKARHHMNGYFGKMQEMAKTNDIDPGIQFMLQDVIELRQHWHAPPVVSQPPTPIIYDHGSHSSGTRGIRISRDRGRSRASHRGGRYYSRGGYSEGYSQQTDQWNVAGGSSTVRPPARAGDLSQFGKISISPGLSFGPTSVFNKKGPRQHDVDLSRPRSNMNVFAMLGAAGADGSPQPEAATARGGANSRKPSEDLGPGGAPAAEGGSVRKRLNLLPRWKSTETGPDKGEDEAAPESAAAPAPMSEADVQKKVKEDIKEYLGVENVEEAILALETLPAKHRHIFVDKMVDTALDGGNKVVVLAEKLFAVVHKQQACSAEAFERGLLPTVEMADDMSIDVPKTYEWLARLMRAAGIDRTRAEELAEKISVLGEPMVQPRDLLMQEFDKIAA